MKGKLICSNPKCSPLFPFTGQVLERVYSEDIMYHDGKLYSTTMYCKGCKGHYYYEANETIPDSCPKCHTQDTWSIAKVWRMVCPTCS